MPALGAGIHVFPFCDAQKQDVDGRDKPGHDDAIAMIILVIPSCPASCRASTSCLLRSAKKDVDGRDKPGHD
jgi:hypothetical protein